MPWTSMRWNWPNVFAIAAFCALPLAGIADAARAPAAAPATQVAGQCVGLAYQPPGCGADAAIRLVRADAPTQQPDTN